ncbi:MAG: hypothetical protein FD180_3281 [Planctomycetota bacterium]|nr:MAG: hypothetical protein FD180_3281 [Planctomycetota bacterium]
MNPPNLFQFDEVSKLQKRLRLVSWVLTLQLVAVFALMAIAWKPPDDVVEATEFKLKSKAGAVLGVWFVDEHGEANLYLRGKDSKLRVSLEAAEAGGGLMLSTGLADQVVLQARGGESGSVVLSDSEGKPRIWIQGEKPGGPFLEVRDKDGKVNWSAPEK